MTGQYSPSGDFDAGASGSADLDNDFGLIVAGGYSLDQGKWALRIEEELMWISGSSKVSSSSFDVRTLGIAFNAIADLPLADQNGFGIYGGLGLGWGATELSVGSNEESGDGFLWQVLLGAYYKLDAHWTLTGGYRWFNHTLSISGTDIDITSHNVDVGVRYSF